MDLTIAGFPPGSILYDGNLEGMVGESIRYVKE